MGREVDSYCHPHWDRRRQPALAEAPATGAYAPAPLLIPLPVRAPAPVRVLVWIQIPADTQDSVASPIASLQCAAAVASLIVPKLREGVSAALATVCETYSPSSCLLWNQTVAPSMLEPCGMRIEALGGQCDHVRELPLPVAWGCLPRSPAHLSRPLAVREMLRGWRWDANGVDA